MSELPEIPELIYPKLNDGQEVVSQPKNRPVRPWDIFNKNVDKVADDIKDERLAICLQCPRLIKTTKQCKECGCFMDIKARLFDATCPLHKWDSVGVNRDSFDYKEN